jgi:hypothetical protein
MKDLPTAEEFIEQYLRGDRVHDDINKVVDEEEAIEAMIEFAKLHVEAALKEASDNAEADYTYEVFGGEFYDQPIYRYFVKKDSILNSYPLENIK